MAKFRDIKTLQKFASVHASIHNHFSLERHLSRRDIFKQNRSDAKKEPIQFPIGLMRLQQNLSVSVTTIGLGILSVVEMEKFVRLVPVRAGFRTMASVK